MKKILTIILALIAAVIAAYFTGKPLLDLVMPAGQQAVSYSVDDSLQVWLWFTLPVCACAVLVAVFALYCRRYSAAIRCAIVVVPMLLGVAAATAYKAFQLHRAVSFAEDMGVTHATISIHAVSLQTIPWSGFVVGVLVVGAIMLLRKQNGQQFAGGNATAPRVSA